MADGGLPASSLGGGAAPWELPGTEQKEGQSPKSSVSFQRKPNITMLTYGRLPFKALPFNQNFKIYYLFYFMYVCSVCVQVSVRPEGGIRFPGTDVVGSRARATSGGC